MRIAIISDIHEDIVNLRKILDRLDRAGYDRLVCLGDISGFSVPFYTYHGTRSAHDCLSLLRERDALIVPGNHDYHAAGRVPQHSPAFDFPSDWYDLEYGQRIELTNSEVWLHEEDDLESLYTADDIAYLRTLPEYRVMDDTGGPPLLFSHYAWPNLSGFNKAFYSVPRDFGGHFGFMASLDCSISFTGHTHIGGHYTAFPRRIRYHGYGRRRLKAFPVVVGIPPATSHQNRSGFCIFNAENTVLRVVRC